MSKYDNDEIVLLTSASRTTTQTSPDFYNIGGVSTLAIILDVTSPGTGSITVTINGKDPASGKYFLLLSGVAVTTVTTNVYRVNPFAAAIVNALAQVSLPKTVQVVVTANNANPMTYSLGCIMTRE